MILIFAVFADAVTLGEIEAELIID